MVPWLKPECLAVLLSYSTLWSKSLCSCVVAIEKGLFVAVFTTLRTHCAVRQKTAPLLNIILHVKMIVHFVILPLLLSGQAQLSSVASCIHLFFTENRIWDAQYEYKGFESLISVTLLLGQCMKSYEYLFGNRGGVREYSSAIRWRIKV